MLTKAVGLAACLAEEDQLVLFAVRSYIAAGSCLSCDEVADKCKY